MLLIIQINNINKKLGVNFDDIEFFKNDNAYALLYRLNKLKLQGKISKNCKFRKVQGFSENFHTL